MYSHRRLGPSLLLLLFLLLSLLVTAPLALRAQADAAHDIIEEKTHWSEEEVEEAQREGRAGSEALARGMRTEAGARESVVSGETAAESEVHAVINPTDSGNIIVSPIRIGAAGEGLLCPVYYTKDFGATWAKSTFQTLPKNFPVTLTGGGDPMLAFDENGRAYLIWIGVFTIGDSSTFGLYWAYSDDGGVTWQQADNDDDGVAVSRYLRTSFNPLVFDKEWAAVDRTDRPSSRNTLYVGYLKAGGGDPSRIVVRRMKPGALRFDPEVVPVSTAGYSLVQFTSIEVDADANVHVTFFGDAGTGMAMWHSVSVDGAASFSPPVKIADVHHPRFSTDATYSAIPGITNRRIYPCPQLAIDRTNGPHRGTLYSTWSADGTTRDLGNGLDIYCARSTDNGATWSDPVIVNDDPRGHFIHQHYPSIAVNDQGVVVISYYDRRADSTNRRTRYSVAYSFDGGATFDATIPVATVATDFITVGAKNNTFGIGEYTQVLSTRSYAIPIWTDGRTNNGDLNIYAAFVPIAHSVTGVDRIVGIGGEAALFTPTLEGGKGRVTFRLDAAASVRVVVTDPLGRTVVVAAEGAYPAGTHAASFDASGLAAGRYFVQLITPGVRPVQAFDVVR